MNTRPSDSYQPPRRIGVLGVGLLGGSVALAAKRFDANTQVVGWVRDDAKGSSLVEAGILDQATDQLPEACLDCDVVIVATPVDRLADFVIRAAESTSDDCLITDVGSTKAEIVAEVQLHAAAANKFVAAHPIAGSEKSGAQFSRADLFDGKPIVITPADETPAGPIQKCFYFWHSLGGDVVQMTPTQHDVTLAAISHVPHLVSSLVARRLSPDGVPLVGTGWRDITRVAAGDPAMWTAICAANRGSILQELDGFREQTDRLRELIASGDDDALKAWLEQAKQMKEKTIIQTPND